MNYGVTRCATRESRPSRDDKMHDNPDETRAARILQASARARVTRKRVKKIRSAKKHSRLAADELDTLAAQLRTAESNLAEVQTAAALRIQRIARGRGARTKLPQGTLSQRGNGKMEKTLTRSAGSERSVLMDKADGHASLSHPGREGCRASLNAAAGASSSSSSTSTAAYDLARIRSELGLRGDAEAVAGGAAARMCELGFDTAGKTSDEILMATHEMLFRTPQPPPLSPPPQRGIEAISVRIPAEAEASSPSPQPRHHSPGQSPLPLTSPSDGRVLRARRGKPQPCSWRNSMVLALAALPLALILFLGWLNAW